VCRGLESFEKLLAASECHGVRTGEVLTELPVTTLEKKLEDDDAHGEIESILAILAARDTFYIGTNKGFGRICPQTFADIYAKWATAKLYTIKTPVTTVDFLNERVLPFFEEQGTR
jgi:hypothetical protein